MSSFAVTNAAYRPASIQRLQCHFKQAAGRHDNLKFPACCEGCREKNHPPIGAAVEKPPRGEPGPALHWALILLIICVARPAWPDAFHPNERRVIDHGGESRAYELYVPGSYTGKTAVPLIVALHGRAGSAGRMARLTGFNQRAAEHGFIVAYPEARGKAWNYVHDIPGYGEGPNDSEFIVSLTQKLGKEYNLDPGRIYVAGISNGGFMAQRLACYAPQRFAAFASVAAAGYGALPRSCPGHSPVNMLYIHGTADPRVPWQGLRMEVNGTPQQVTLSMADSLKFWSRRNACGSAVESRELARSGASPGTFVRVLSASHCESGAAVSLYAVVGGGHDWPGSRGVIPPSVAGRVNMDIHASDVIWSFFRRHTLKR